MLLLMNIASPEQQKISDYLKDHNVIADSVAGSGKTTTVLHIANNYYDENILLLTYNKKLRIETATRASKLGLINLQVHNYHSFAVKFYNKKCFTDTEIKKHMHKEPLESFNYTMIIIDEAQDMTDTYHKLVCKIVFDNNTAPRICVLGDRYQSIYQFNNADERYIIYAKELLTFNSLPWKELKLSQTFRVSKENCDFINNCMLKQNRLISHKTTNIKPRYIFCDLYGKRPYTIVIEYLKKYKPEDIFILAPSVKNDRASVKQLANSLSKNYPIYIPVTDEEKIDEDMIKNKLVFSSFHQIKGLERPVIIIYHFDNGYFEFYNKNSNVNVCPNTLYVATTRSLEHMVLLHDYTKNFLPFMNNSVINNYCKVETLQEVLTFKSILPKFVNNFTVNNMFSTVMGRRVIDIIMRMTIKNENSIKFEISVKNLCKNLSVNIIDNALTFFDVRTIHNSCTKGKVINLALETVEKTKEPVYEINETAIPALYEYNNTGKMSIIKYLNDDSSLHEMLNNRHMMDSDDEEKGNDTIQDVITCNNLNIAKLLLIANKYNCSKNKVVHKIYQIKNYNWISIEQMDHCMKRMSQHISNKALYKVRMCAVKQDELHNKVITTVIDCIDENKIYTFNCNNNITPKNLLECAVNMYIYCIHNKTNNIKTSNMIKLENKYKIYEKITIMLKEKILLFQHNDTMIKFNIVNDIKTMLRFCNENMIRISNEIINIKEYCTFCIFNIATHEIISVSSTMEKLRKMIDFLIVKKFYTIDKITDEDFVEQGIDVLNYYKN